MSAAAALPLNISLSSSVKKLAVAFPQELRRVFDRLEEIAQQQRPAKARIPSKDTLDWALEVLLGVVPSAYLIGAEIDPFESEIHVTWENADSGKSVIVFFPGPGQLKIYRERVHNDAVVEHELVPTMHKVDVSRHLRWLFQ